MDELNGRPTICSRRSCRTHPERTEAGSMSCEEASEGSVDRKVWVIAAVEEQQEPDQNPGG